ncbi:MAG: hypothetical protein HQL65_14660 [Magnetococcales bacterium]|nr:hypothetical protein [Magnetococcales bacterium]
MATIIELQIRRDRLLERLESLQKRVTHGDKTVEYDLTQAKTALELLDREMTRVRHEGCTGAGAIVRQVRVRSDKDL